MVGRRLSVALLDGQCRSYLRELGALDETGMHGKQVIIPNYIQAASNCSLAMDCIVTTQHYMVCCTTDCNEIMTEIESEIAQPTAQAARILEVVGNMTTISSLEDEGSVRIDDALAAQLRSIEAANGGEVPLHGRLYLQWLQSPQHYVFPRECPTAPSEFSGEYVATLQEMQAMRATENDTVLPHNVTLAKEELQWMSQWSEEEELLLSYEGLSNNVSWRRRLIIGLNLSTEKGGFFALLAASVAGPATATGNCLYDNVGCMSGE
ncbi:hypothetical protein AK812_SmicGene15244 [Symbiodinium microadriaticum]|uniref:Uncharacterized protein n=1 Tax=Symbiodinium microadriaticum TaxID=2951 RepID=A0A1Q9E3I9_SYMMI|nr:hypothetical protein AK812_SmicGene15244 [Symbiodinium microadriaticum]